MELEASDLVRYAAVGLGAVLGANLRYLVANWAADRWGADFPYGTFLINVSGAFVIGVFLAVLTSRSGINPLWRLFFATGFLGGYTTFSSYTFEALALAEAGDWAAAAWYVLGSNGLGLLAAYGGMVLARALSR